MIQVKSWTQSARRVVDPFVRFRCRSGKPHGSGAPSELNGLDSQPPQQRCVTGDPAHLAHGGQPGVPRASVVGCVIAPFPSVSTMCSVLVLLSYLPFRGTMGLTASWGRLLNFQREVCLPCFLWTLSGQGYWPLETSLETDNMCCVYQANEGPTMSDFPHVADVGSWQVR